MGHGLNEMLAERFAGRVVRKDLKEISPNSILISGGQTTVENLFYNMGNRTIGLLCPFLIFLKIDFRVLSDRGRSGITIDIVAKITL